MEVIQPKPHSSSPSGRSPLPIDEFEEEWGMMAGMGRHSRSAAALKLKYVRLCSILSLLIVL